MQINTPTVEAGAVKLPRNGSALPENSNDSAAKNERIFFEVASVATGVAFGILLASLQSLEKDVAGFAFHVSLGTLAAFLIGGALGFLYWKIVALRTSAVGVTSVLLRGMQFTFLLGGIAAFLYPLRFLPADKLPDIFVGLTSAAFALGLAGFIISRIVGFLNSDEQKYGGV